ncbi:hypothetical protein [Selenomonas sp. TAMA-11512]|uniref:hypothetical protein n=1 Tax=Selenomonas sp. TAMA-11512 TaxID=3095337 RepID=UPI0030D39E33
MHIIDEEVFQMIERIEKITRAKAISRDIHRPFKQGEERGNGERFQEYLNAAQGSVAPKKQGSEPLSVPGEAYRLDVGRATQSLFYEDASVIHPKLLRKALLYVGS